jgi:hypothetical protein
MTTSRMISGDELKYRNGLAGFLGLGIALPYLITPNPLAGGFALTRPFDPVNYEGRILLCRSIINTLNASERTHHGQGCRSDASRCDLD